MVGGYGVDYTIGNGLTQSVAVGGTLNGGVALDARAEHGILLI